MNQKETMESMIIQLRAERETLNKIFQYNQLIENLMVGNLQLTTENENLKKQVEVLLKSGAPKDYED